MASSGEVMAGFRSRQNQGIVIWGLAALSLLAATWSFNDLLFHSLAGLLAVAAAVSIFVIAWNSRAFAENGFLLLLGTAYLGVATLDVLNTLTHPGIGVFTGYPEDVCCQLQVASSLLNGCALLIAPRLLDSRPRPWLLLGSVAAVVATVVLLILGLQVFPYCGPVRSGMLPFRQVSVAVIVAVLAGALVGLRRVGKRLDRRFCRLLTVAILVALAAEACFALVDCFLGEGSRARGVVSFLGHVFRIGSYFLVCGAVIETGLREPYGILFRQLRESEERFRVLVDEAPVAVSLLNGDASFAYVNRRFVELFGYTLADLPDKSRWFELAYPDPAYRARMAALWAEDSVPEGPGPKSRERIVYVRCRDGTTRTIRLRNSSLVSRQQIVSYEDVTEDRRAEAEVARYQLHLEELVEKHTRELEESREHLRRHERLASIGTLAAGIAHEINNPIGGILLAAQNVQRLSAKPEDRALVDACVQDIIESAGRCREIVQNLMSFARRRPTRKTLSDLNTCVRRSARLTEQYIWDLGGALELDLTEHLPRVPVNPLAMEQVLVNLMRNAAESGNQGFRVRVVTERTEKGVRVILSDNGRGISEDQLKHVFDPFFTTRLVKGGTGLGLSIVHGIVTEQGGIIDVHSRLGSGTTFTIDLPLAGRDSGVGDHGEGADC